MHGLRAIGAFDTYRIFLSSGDDLVDVRDEFDLIVTKVVNTCLLEAELPVRVEVDRWENTAPQRAAEGVNALFVTRALRSSLTLVLIRDELRPGTEEELTEVAKIKDGPQLAILWFEPSESADHEEVQRIEQLLAKYRDKILWRPHVTHGGPEQSRELTRIALGTVLSALAGRLQSLETLEDRSAVSI